MIQLPAHYLVRLQVRLYKIDSWDNKSFLIYLDGVEMYRRALSSEQGLQVCGQQIDGWNEDTIDIDVSVEHN
jgi:hypothetical protein